MTKIIAVVLSLSIIVSAGCASTKDAQPQGATEISETTIPVKIIGGPATVGAIPRAVVYRTNGNFNDNVPVTLSADRKKIVAFPAPSDISPECAPLPLADGYLLDRRGISANSAFTRYTYAEYAALPSAPDIMELKESIIGGAEVTDIILLPMSLSEAAADSAKCDNLVTNGFPGCNILLKRNAIQLTPQ